MRHTTKQDGAMMLGSALRRLSLVILALLILPAYGAGSSGGGAPLRNPALSNLQIEIWPEFDRPAALVILRGTLAKDTKLPAELMLHLPASSGGPSAVAYSTTAGSDLLNLEYQRSKAKDFTTLRFKTPARYFHVEFYDPISTGTNERSYTYVWPGDMKVGRLRLVVQEPAGATGFSVQPKLDAAVSEQDGMRYRSADLGAFEAGKPLSINVRYTKPDARTSSQIVHPQPAVTVSTPSTGGSEDIAMGVSLFIATLSLLAGIVTAVFWWRGRAKSLATQAPPRAKCSKCGAQPAETDRYCSNCGARLK